MSKHPFSIRVLYKNRNSVAPLEGYVLEKKTFLIGTSHGIGLTNTFVARNTKKRQGIVKSVREIDNTMNKIDVLVTKAKNSLLIRICRGNYINVNTERDEILSK